MVPELIIWCIPFVISVFDVFLSLEGVDFLPNL